MRPLEEPMCIHWWSIHRWRWRCVHCGAGGAGGASIGGIGGMSIPGGAGGASIGGASIGGIGMSIPGGAGGASIGGAEVPPLVEHPGGISACPFPEEPEVRPSAAWRHVHTWRCRWCIHRRHRGMSMPGGGGASIGEPEVQVGVHRHWHVMPGGAGGASIGGAGGASIGGAGGAGGAS